MSSMTRASRWLAAAMTTAIVASACTGSATESATTGRASPQTTNTSAPAETTTSTSVRPSTSTTLRPSLAIAVLEPCAGEFAGSYAGDASGSARAAMTESGEITVVLTTDDEQVRMRGVGTVKEQNLALIATSEDGGSLQGVFDAANCTAQGVWQDGSLQGEWRVAASPLEVGLQPGDCAGGVYKGEGAVTVSLGGTALTVPSPFGENPERGVSLGPITLASSGVTLGGETVIGIGDSVATVLGIDITATEEGAVIGEDRVVLDSSSISFGGSSSIDYNTMCLSQAVATHEVTGFAEIADTEIEVRVGIGFTTYAVPSEVLFDFGSDALTVKAADTLDRLAASIASRFSQAPLTVLGHTDSIGSEESNLDLSLRRAAAVERVFEADARLAGISIFTYGLGETQPAAANTNPDGTDNPDGRRLNRRVEVVVDTSGGISACEGAYAGSFVGATLGTTEATLQSDGLLEVTFVPDGLGPSVTGVGTVTSDGTISPISGVSIGGKLDFSTCIAAGPWESLGLSGQWTLAR